jgi:hypothetical protein
VELIPAGLFMVVLVVTPEDMVVAAAMVAVVVVVDAITAELSSMFIRTICRYIKIFF